MLFNIHKHYLHKIVQNRIITRNTTLVGLISVQIMRLRTESDQYSNSVKYKNGIILNSKQTSFIRSDRHFRNLVRYLVDCRFEEALFLLLGLESTTLNWAQNQENEAVLPCPIWLQKRVTANVSRRVRSYLLSILGSQRAKYFVREMS